MVELVYETGVSTVSGWYLRTVSGRYLRTVSGWYNVLQYSIPLLDENFWAFMQMHEVYGQGSKGGPVYGSVTIVNLEDPGKPVHYCDSFYTNCLQNCFYFIFLSKCEFHWTLVTNTTTCN